MLNVYKANFNIELKLVFLNAKNKLFAFKRFVLCTEGITIFVFSLTLLNYSVVIISLL